MLNKLLNILLIPIILTSGVLSAYGATDYKIKDVGTLETYSSLPLAINSSGNILGYYYLDKEKQTKNFFLRDSNGTFHNIPSIDGNIKIDWKKLNDNGKVFGEGVISNNLKSLYIWDVDNGIVSCGELPGREIIAVNNKNQVLVQFNEEIRGNEVIIRPVIWENGRIIKLKGAPGNIGTESRKSFAYDLNNKGEVVGESYVITIYKNNEYVNRHAVKWVNGQPIDLHYSLPKIDFSCAKCINDAGDIIYLGNTTWYSINNGKFNAHQVVIDNPYTVLSHRSFTQLVQKDSGSIWMWVRKFVDVNDRGEVVAEAETIYGETHTILLTPPWVFD